MASCCGKSNKEEEPTPLELLNLAEEERELKRKKELARAVRKWNQQMQRDEERERKRLAKLEAELKEAEQKLVDEKLYEYARIGLLNRVEEMFERGAVDGAFLGGDGDSAISAARKEGHSHILHWLEAGGATERKNFFKQEEVDLNLYQAARDKNLEAAKLAIAQGANPDGHTNYWGVTALHKACVRELLGGLPMMQVLLEAGAEVDHVDRSNGMTPLHKAAMAGIVENVQWLVVHGANIEAVDYKNRTPLHMATDWGHFQTVRLLIGNGANIKHKDNNDRTVGRLAEIRGHDAIVEFLAKCPWNLAEARADRKQIFRRALEKCAAALMKKKEQQRDLRDQPTQDSSGPRHEPATPAKSPARRNTQDTGKGSEHLDSSSSVANHPRRNAQPHRFSGSIKRSPPRKLYTGRRRRGGREKKNRGVAGDEKAADLPSHSRK